jgi:cyclic beta-1,2-glucan synthetase
MVDKRRRSPLPLSFSPILTLAAWLTAYVAVTGNDCLRAGEEVRLSDAAEQGTFNVGPARAVASRVNDPAAGGDVLKLDYTIPPGAAAGVYAKSFPGGLSASRVEVVQLAAKAANRGEHDQIVLAVEIKGSVGIQRIPIRIDSDWTSGEEMINWPAIGILNEVVISANPTTQRGAATGSVAIDIRFRRIGFLRRLGMSPAGRLAGVLLTSVVLWLCASVVGMVGSRWPGRFGSRQTEARPSPLAAVKPTTSRPLHRDFVQGAGTVMIGLLVLATALQGGKGPLEEGWTVLAIAVAGAGVAEWWKYGLTRRHLSPAEVFQNTLATGVCAASASSLQILQAPAVWSDMLLLNRTVAAVSMLVYHAVSASRLASSGRQLGAPMAAILIGTPYVIGGLTLLESSGLLQTLGGSLTAGALSLRPEMLEFVGRVFVVFSFNEAVANGLALATQGPALKSLRGHATLAVVATAAIAAPWVASLGSSATVAAWQFPAGFLAIIATTIVSQAGLWAEAYLITGLALDAIHGQAPSRDSCAEHPRRGMVKGMVYSGVFMGVLQLLGMLANDRHLRWTATTFPLPAAMLFGAVVFPLLKTIIETFDGSYAFFKRVVRSYASPVLYLRGAVAGIAVGWGLIGALPDKSIATRAYFGFGLGALAFAGVDILSDLCAAVLDRGRVRPARLYSAHALLGGFIGAAIGFYFDAAQVSVVAAKFQRYLAVGTAPQLFDIYPLVSKWGHLNLGNITGGASLLFAEALAGVITWSTAAWLFAINRAFMTAYFQKEATLIRTLFTGSGLTALGENMIQVLRWGLWMSPVINSFLRPMGEPTWYNQDGAIRTVFATVHQMTASPDAFRLWSLQVFTGLLAYDSVRILIWMDHMGLRVATLVNLSFLGMDKLERRMARALAPFATSRCIPEGVKRFTTWGPLLIPFYIPRGGDWDTAWNSAEAIRLHEQGGLLDGLVALPLAEKLVLAAGAVVSSTAVFAGTRWLRRRFGKPSLSTWSLNHAGYEVTLREDGALWSRSVKPHCDPTRRSYDLLDPAGRALFVVDATGAPDRRPDSWPVIGNFPDRCGAPSRLQGDVRRLRVVNDSHDIRVEIEVALPGPEDAAELWTVTLENLSDRARAIKVVPYVEWVLNQPESDRGHTQYNRLFTELEYASELHAVLAWERRARVMGLLAADRRPEGFLTSRPDFIGRARSVWSPRVLETLAFAAARDTAAHPTFDPIASLILNMPLPAHGSTCLRLLIGLARDKSESIELVARHLGIGDSPRGSADRRRSEFHPIGHGEIPPATPQPYFEFSDDRRRLLVHTAFTPRPYDHTLASALGHVVAVTNRGLHTTSSVNSQQNRLTPDWSDFVTREVPAEAFYLYDPETAEWFAPTYHPLNDSRALNEAEFGVDGSATFVMKHGTLETELVVFVPPDEPVGVYMLTVKNRGEHPRRLRLAAYFQIVLAGQPEYSGPLLVHVSEPNAVFFENPRNTFRTGPAFVALSCGAEHIETERGRFFGEGRDVAHPELVRSGKPLGQRTRDDRPIAAMLTTLEIPARGERTIVVLLGQTDERQRAEATIRKYQDVDAALTSLEATRRWWLSLMDTMRVRTNNPDLDGYLDWLKYQALAERIWARRGFYQASGAYGFRDQLQDSVNMIWVDPEIARRQIVLHAAQQFVAGDVAHWFHLLQDGRTGFVGRTHASDNLLWLVWAVGEYVRATGDDSLLDERVGYIEAEQPFEPLPGGKHGIGFDPLRSAREESVYRHCLRALDLVLNKRMGTHGLPLMGTGDWNDGLDEIGSQGRGESVWLGFFLYYILDRFAPIVERKEGRAREEHYLGRLDALKGAIELTWRGDRYLRAIHDDGTEIGVAGSGIWEIDALTASWAVMSGINPARGQVVFETALRILEQENTILLGWPPLREDSQPYLGRSSQYPEGVRENGMYCHGVQWLVGAARTLAERSAQEGRAEQARGYIDTAYRIWLKIAPLRHVNGDVIETYGGQPNQQAADMVTTFDPGRMIWNGYTGAAGWMLRQAFEGLLGLSLQGGRMVASPFSHPKSELVLLQAIRDLKRSPFDGLAILRGPAERIAREPSAEPISAPRSP